MADLTSSQDISRNLYSPYFQIHIFEKIVLSIMKRFRFCEIARVIEVDAPKMKVKCELLYRKIDKKIYQGGDTININLGRTTRWIPVHSTFASLRAGIIAPPAIGDYGIVFFKLGDTAGAFFFGTSWGGRRPVPETHEVIQNKDLVVKRNDSWVRIDPDSDMELFNTDGNQAMIASGYNKFIATDRTSEKYYDEEAGSFLYRECISESLKYEIDNRIVGNNPYSLVNHEQYYDQKKGVMHYQQKMSNQHINRKDGKEFIIAAFSHTKNDQIGIYGAVQTMEVSSIRVPSDTNGFVAEIGDTLSDVAFNTYTAPYALTLHVSKCKKTLTSSRYTSTFTMERSLTEKKVAKGGSLVGGDGHVTKEFVDIYSATVYEYLDKYGVWTKGLTVRRQNISQSGSSVEEINMFGDQCVVRSLIVSPSGVLDETNKAVPIGVWEYELEFMRFEVEEFDNLRITDDTVSNQLKEIASGTYDESDRFKDKGEAYLIFERKDNTRLKAERGV